MYDEAIPLYLKVLGINEKTLGKEHPNTAKTLYSIGVLYHNQRKYDEALVYYKQSIDIREKVLVPEHPDTAQSLNKLAILYKNQNKSEEALIYYKRALEIREKVLGPSHKDTAESLNSLAVFYNDQERYDEALPLYQRALEIKENLLGPLHSETIESLSNLALLYENQDQYKNAYPLYKRVLELSEKVYEPDAKYTLYCIENLAEVSKKLGEYEESIGFYKRAAEINERIYGNEHLKTASSFHELASVYYDYGDRENSISFNKKALTIREKILDPNHTDIASSLNNLALVYSNEGMHEEALPLYLRTIKIKEIAYGHEHSSTAISLINLALLYEKLEMYNEALELYSRAYNIRVKVFGANHSRTLKVKEYIDDIKVLLDKKKTSYQLISWNDAKNYLSKTLIFNYTGIDFPKADEIKEIRLYTSLDNEIFLEDLIIDDKRNNYSAIVDGDLQVGNCVEMNSDKLVNFLIVTGNLYSKGVLLTGKSYIDVHDELHCINMAIQDSDSCLFASRIYTSAVLGDKSKIYSDEVYSTYGFEDSVFVFEDEEEVLLDELVYNGVANDFKIKNYIKNGKEVLKKYPNIPNNLNVLKVSTAESSVEGKIIVGGHDYFGLYDKNLGRIVFSPQNAVSIVMVSNQFVITWSIEKIKNASGISRGDYRWFINTYTWPDADLLSTYEIENRNIIEWYCIDCISCPKKYNGSLIILNCTSEDDSVKIYIVKMSDGTYRETIKIEEAFEWLKL